MEEWQIPMPYHIRTDDGHIIAEIDATYDSNGSGKMPFFTVFYPQGDKTEVIITPDSDPRWHARLLRHSHTALTDQQILAADRAMDEHARRYLRGVMQEAN